MRLARSTCIGAVVLSGAGLLAVSARADSAAPASASPAAGPRLEIASDTGCPSGPAVAAALASISPPADWPSGWVRIHAEADRLLVDLSFEEPTRREVRVPPDCGTRAATVALVIATWTGTLSSDAAATPVLPGQAVSRGPEQAASSTAPAIAVNQLELGAGMLLAVSGGIAPGVAVQFVQTRVPRGLGWQVALSLPAPREGQSAGSSTRWTRAAAAIELDGRVTVGRLAASIDAGLAGAYTLASGQGYSIQQDAQALTGGIVAGARLAMPWRRLRLWTDVRAYKWLFPQTVAVTTTDGRPVATIGLPSVDVQWAVGVAYVLR